MPRARSEIINTLRLRNPKILVGDFDRPNLILDVQRRTNLERQLLETIRGCHTSVPSVPSVDRRGIIYCPTRIDTERIARFLRISHVEAEHYHAGMDPGNRERVLDRFSRGLTQTVVATIAFGMGIDVPDVRYVVHTMMPSSLETYHQEIGRAGRDDQPSDCVLLYHHTDPGEWAGRFEHEASDVTRGSEADA